MSGKNNRFRVRAHLAFASCVLFSTLTFGLTFGPGAASAEGAAASALRVTSVSQVMAQERAVLRLGAAARLESLSHSAGGTPAVAAKRDTRAVTAISRNVDTGTAAQLAAASGKLDFAVIDALPAASSGAEWQCLAEAIYFESRGEPLAGQIAVAEVVLNRVEDRHFPKTICGVTRQGANSRVCQFSYACDGRPEAMTSAAARARSEKLATLMMSGRVQDLTDGATHFHALRVRPGWSGRMTRTAQIGHHSFYRTGVQLAQR